MPLGISDENEPADDQGFVQLAFPFEVQRVALPKEPNPYSLALTESEDEEGGGFQYENCPEIFLGRVGYGPLRIAWDTNVIIDYAEFGDLMWEDGEFNPPITEARYRRELIALDSLVNLWMMRDIRIRAPLRQIHDAHRALSEDQWAVREWQLEQFLSALACIELDKKVLSEVKPFDILSDENDTNDKWDESLVLEAVATGCHVFVTRDGGLRKRLRQSARDSFLLIMRPSDLLATLAQANELGLGSGNYMLPDNHKWIHFMRATDGGVAGHQ
jgi:hypothetical protein